MKKIPIILLLIIASVEISAQIPNGGFEDWETIQNYEKPMLWDTNQDSTYIRFEKDTISVEGNYSLKAVPGPNTGFKGDCSSKASIKYGLPGPVGENRSLVFFVKTTASPFGFPNYSYLNIQGSFYEAGSYDSSYEWETLYVIEDFTKIQFPITNPNIDSLSIWISGAATLSPTDPCIPLSYAWVDGIGIEDTEITNSSIELESQKTDVLVFPNPTTGIIQINQTKFKFNKFQLFSLDGELIKDDYIEQSRITLPNNLRGVFLLKLIEEQGQKSFEVSKRIIIK